MRSRDGLLVLHGIVLSAMPIGEYDKRLVILTKEKGKITAFARGARRTKNSLLAPSNPFAHGAYFAYPSRDSYTVTGAECDGFFASLTSDPEKIWYGWLFLEEAEYFSVENADERTRIALLYAALAALKNERLDPEQVRLVYDLKTYAVNGEYPDLSGQLPLREAVSYALSFIYQTPPERLFSFALADEDFKQLSYLFYSYRNRTLGHTFRSEEFLGLMDQ